VPGPSHLNRADLPDDPFALFEEWWARARKASAEPAAMTLATASPDGEPWARTVLLRAVDERGFVFFTNYESRKGGELAANPFAALLFFWRELERQVRIEGAVERIAGDESDAYFRTRPLASRIGAWASPQSRVISGRGWLLARAAEMGLRHGLSPGRPPNWGGYRVNPVAIEFWQGRPSRLHDRLLYSRGDSGWARVRLAP
jgi:pyridoxamine 5'-phosphate oxidase